MDDSKTKKSGKAWLAISIVLIVVLFVVVIPACQFLTVITGSLKIDTAQFTLTDPATATSGADGGKEPGLWIDTNMSINLFWGTLKTSKPYSIAVDKTDTSFTYASVVFTKLNITYDDGSSETNLPSLPLTIKSEDYTSTNSVSGGNIAQTKMRLISGKIPGVITRDEPFTLDLEGHFKLDDGSQVPFKINQHYDVVIEKTTKPTMDVLQDI